MYKIFEFAKVHIRKFYKQFEVKELYVSDGLSKVDVVVACNLYNEKDQLQAFLDYYRELGFSEFIILDNNSTDGLQDYLKGQDGISLFYTRHKYNRSRYGIDWMNGIFDKYCKNKWILYVDADEFFVYPFQDKWKINDLVRNLKARKQFAMGCMMLDMYSRNKISQNICLPGRNPVEICRFFDKDGYHYFHEKKSGVQWIKGGVRGRFYFRDNLQAGPSLNKIPLIYWKPWYGFIKSTHELAPYYVNFAYHDQRFMTGTLLHTKFLSRYFSVISDEMLTAMHTSEYQTYKNDPADLVFFSDEISKEFSGWNSIYEEGLMRVPEELQKA